MKHSCESRIRGYTKEVKCGFRRCFKASGLFLTHVFLWAQLLEASKSIEKANVRAEFLKASDCLVEMLKEAKYNGCYFDRTDDETNRLCTREGWFTCQV